MSERNSPRWVPTAVDDAEPDAPLNVGEEPDVNRRNKSIKQQQIVDRTGAEAVVRNIMATAIGRRWMADLLRFCDLFDDTFPNTDQLEMAARVGLRRVGQRLLNEVCEACPERYAQMRAELREGK